MPTRAAFKTSPLEGPGLRARSSYLALFFRLIPPFIIFSQLALPLTDLLRIPLWSALFATTILSGYALALCRLRPWLSLLLAALTPLLFRAFAFALIFLIASFRPGPESDSLFLLFDQSFFPACLPAIWLGISSFLALRSLRFLRLEAVLNSLLFFLIFYSESGYKLTRYSHPSQLALVAGLLIFSELARLAFAEDQGRRDSLRRSLFLFLGLVPLCLLFLLLLGRYSERATASGGGLIKPTLSRFDFSRYLKLESEISLSQDLVLMVKKDSEDQNIYLRRHILAGYDKKKGFFAETSPWIEELPASLPRQASRYASGIRPGAGSDKGEAQGRRNLEQEYYIVNFDPGAFIAMNAPLSSTPLANWDNSSFKSVYRVESSVPTEQLFLDIAEEEKEPDLDPRALAYYCDYGQDPEIAALASSLSRDAASPYSKVLALLEALRTDYRYSLKPGTAEDGDQLKHFLFKGKKGYCSYFAFSMTLMLRSLGIPARVAVGFFLDPGSGILSLYPVRADMAHAWVEVYFPGQGWVEFDPTSDIMAEGEDLVASGSLDPGQYLGLIQEILQHREGLVSAPRRESPDESLERIFAFSRAMALKALLHWYLYLPLFFFGLIVFRHLLRFFPLSRKGGARARTLKAFARALCRRGDSGFRRRQAESLLEYCQALDILCSSQAPGAHTRACRLRDQALYAPSFSPACEVEFKTALHEMDCVFKARLGPIGRLLSFCFIPPLRRAKFWPKAGLILIILSGAMLFAQSPPPIPEGGSYAVKNPEELLEEAQSAIDAENYDLAAARLKTGQAVYPQMVEFPKRLAYLYYDKGLYSLAFEEFKKAETLTPADQGLVYTMSDTLGRLNREKESIAYLKRTLELDPRHREAIADLGWMYFKVHQTEAGIELLIQASKTLGFDKGFEMTLGTLYAERYEYEAARRHYQASIDAALASESARFAGVAYYNLSILESKFYRYPEAAMLTEKSIQHYDRASARLARGELAQKSLALAEAKREYDIAFGYDDSPLASISIADLALDCGRLEEARIICEENLRRADHAWMLNFGTDLENHGMDIYKILKEVYEGLAFSEARKPVADILELAGSRVKALEYAARAWYCRERYRSLSLRISTAYRREGNQLLADLNMFNALEAYPRRARAYLRRAREVETALVPESLPSYELEEALLTGDIPAAGQAADSLSQPWEGDTLVDGLSRMGRILKSRGKHKELRALEERLYSLNPGSLLKSGLSLPAHFRVETSSSAARNWISWVLRPMLARAAFDLRRQKSEADCPFTLVITYREGLLGARILDSRSGAEKAQIASPMPKWSFRGLRDFSKSLIQKAFSFPIP